MNLWNVRSLAIPPIITYKSSDEKIDIAGLHKLCQDIRQLLDKNDYMRAEYLVLSRIVYRMKQKFRTARDFKSLEKLCKALGRFYSLNLTRDIQHFLNVTPMKYTEETYLPSKNLLDYILVRLQGTAKLMERIIETSKLTAELFDSRLKTGEFWKIAFILFSLVSRIYVLGKYLLNHICDYYELLLPFSDKLKSVGKKWLPDDYNFPKDLKIWLNVDLLDLEKDFKENETQKNHTLHYFNLLRRNEKELNEFEENVIVEIKDFIDQKEELKYEENLRTEYFEEVIILHKNTDKKIDGNVICVASQNDIDVGENIQEPDSSTKKEEWSISQKKLKLEGNGLKKMKKKERNKKKKLKQKLRIMNIKF